jgi:hypothetical protein
VTEVQFAVRTWCKAENGLIAHRALVGLYPGSACPQLLCQGRQLRYVANDAVYATIWLLA